MSKCSPGPTTHVVRKNPGLRRQRAPPQRAYSIQLKIYFQGRATGFQSMAHEGTARCLVGIARGHEGRLRLIWRLRAMPVESAGDDDREPARDLPPPHPWRGSCDLLRRLHVPLSLAGLLWPGMAVRARASLDLGDPRGRGCAPGLVAGPPGSGHLAMACGFHTCFCR